MSDTSKPPRCITESQRLEALEKKVEELKTSGEKLLRMVEDLQEDIRKIIKHL